MKRTTTEERQRFAHMVVHCNRSRYDVYVGRGRGSKWGNPFYLKNEAQRDEVCEVHESWLLEQPERIAQLRKELKGKILACWCAPKRCHAHTLAALANRP